MPLDTEISAQILEAVRRLVEERLIPAEAEVEETNAIPQPLVDAMKEMGLFGPLHAGRIRRARFRSRDRGRGDDGALPRLRGLPLAAGYQ